MDRQAASLNDDVVDNQILVLLERHRRLNFLTLADALPLYTWQSLFAALSRLRGQDHVDLLPLAADYQVVWRRGGQPVTVLPTGA